MPNGLITDVSTIQSLWGGYGQLLRVHLKKSISQNIPSTLIVKHVTPPKHGSGISHDRKVKSYEVERAFYQ